MRSSLLRIFGRQLSLLLAAERLIAASHTELGLRMSPDEATTHSEGWAVIQIAELEQSTRHRLGWVWLCMVVGFMDVMLALLAIEACVAFLATRSGGIGLVASPQFRRRAVLMLLVVLPLAAFMAMFLNS